MVEVSRDGRRVYFTNSLYAAWDEQFYPEGVGNWMVKLDADPKGGMQFDPKFFLRDKGTSAASDSAGRRRRLVGFLLFSLTNLPNENKSLTDRESRALAGTLAMTNLWPWFVLLGWERSMASIQGWAGFSPFASACRSAAAWPCSRPCRRLRWATRSRSGGVVALIAMLRARLECQRLLQYASAALLVGYGVYRAVPLAPPALGRDAGRISRSDSLVISHGHGAWRRSDVDPGFSGHDLARFSRCDGSSGGAGGHASHLPLIAGPGQLTAAVLVHTLGHLLVAGLVALLVYEKLGLTILKTAWFNIDFAWALALIVTGVILALV